MNKDYECPSMEIVEFCDDVYTYSEDDGIDYLGGVSSSSGGWLPWI